MICVTIPHPKVLWLKRLMLWTFFLSFWPFVYLLWSICSPLLPILLFLISILLSCLSSLPTLDTSPFFGICLWLHFYYLHGIWFCFIEVQFFKGMWRDSLIFYSRSFIVVCIYEPSKFNFCVWCEIWLKLIFPSPYLFSCSRICLKSSPSPHWTAFEFF